MNKSGDIFDVAETVTFEDKPSEPNAIYEFLKDIGKGALEGLVKAGRIMGPIPTGEPEEVVQQRFTEELDETIPSQPSFAGSAARRGLNIAGPAAIFPGGAQANTLLRSLLAGTAGQGAQELGGGPLVQAGAELAAFAAPGLSRTISPTKSQQQTVDFMRSQGATEEQIAPLLQSQRTKIPGTSKELPSKVETLGKIASRGRGTERSLEGTRKILGEVYGNLRDSEAAKKTLSPSTTGNVVQDLQQKLKNMPASVRNVIAEDFAQLTSGPITGDKLIKFYQDINANVGPKTKQLTTLKDPIRNALSTLDVDLGKNFKMTNELYQKFSETAKILKPSLASKLFDTGEALSFGGAILTGNFPLMSKIAGVAATRKLAKEMLTNPRLQNLSKQMATALDKGKYAIANRLKNQYINKIVDNHPEAAKELEAIDFFDLED